MGNVVILLFVWTLILLTGQELSYVKGSKILLIPAPGNSHVFYFLEVGEELMRKGHQVHVLVSPRWPRPDRFNKSSVNKLTYNASEPEFFDTPDKEEVQLEMFEMLIKYADKIDFIMSIRYFDSLARTLCTNPLGDENLFKRLSDMNFDFALTDAFTTYKCMYVLLYRLGIPYGSLVTMNEPWLMRNPALPSFAPFQLRTWYTEKMTFWQRLYNLYTMVDLYAWPRIHAIDSKLVSTYAPETPPVSIEYLAGQSQIWFINTDVAIDYPLPTMPNVVHVGGLTTRPAKKLPPNLEKFFNEAEHGVVLVSFGGEVKLLPRYVLDKLFAAFKVLRQRVLFRLHTDKLEDVPENVMIEKWLPQNDILGHPKTKLFITHCGNNGQFEALYHAVPMLGVPIFGDQHYNAFRMQYRGYGIVMSLDKFTSEELAAKSQKIIGDNTYKQNIELGRDIFKSCETPRERVSYWIEHILKFGGDHLHSHALEMPWYQYMMLDILALLLLCSAIVMYSLYKFVNIVRRLIFGENSANNKRKRD